MATECNPVESETKVNTINVIEMAKSANQDGSNQSTSSSTTQDLVPGTACGSTGDDSDPANRETASPESEDGSGVFSFSKNLRAGHKSVCFHSVTCQPAERKITNGKFLFPYLSIRINAIILFA